MQSQIDALKSSLADKDAQLRQAQQTATDAQAAASQGGSGRHGATTGLHRERHCRDDSAEHCEGSVGQRKLRWRPRFQTKPRTSKKAINSPDALHYKGITLSPAGSFLAAETVWRSAATGGDINTALTGVPLQ